MKALKTFWDTTYAELSPLYFVKKSWALDVYSTEELEGIVNQDAFVNVGRLRNILSALSLRHDRDPNAPGSQPRSSYEGIVVRKASEWWKGMMMRKFGKVCGSPIKRSFHFGEYEAKNYLDPVFQRLERKAGGQAIEFAKPTPKPDPVPLVDQYVKGVHPDNKTTRRVYFNEYFVRAGDILEELLGAGLPDGGTAHEAYAHIPDMPQDQDWKIGQPLDLKRSFVIALLLAEDQTERVRKQAEKKACRIYKPLYSNSY